MPRRITSVHDMAIDEVSLVDIPAVQGALVMLQKNFQEGNMPPEGEVQGEIQGAIFDRAGNELPEDYDFQPGIVYFDAAGMALEVDTESVEDAANANEFAEVGKGAFFQGSAPVKETGSEFAKGLAHDLREQLSKAHTGDAATREVLSKALAAITAAEQVAAQAQTIAKSERTIRLTGEFVEVAKKYNVPGDPTQLGGVLMRMAETMADADCAVIHKALTSAGEIIFQEIGLTGTGTADGSDPMEAAEQYAAAQVSKAAGGKSEISKANAVVEFYNDNPEAYEEYLASKRG